MKGLEEFRLLAFRNIITCSYKNVMTKITLVNGGHVKRSRSQSKTLYGLEVVCQNMHMNTQVKYLTALILAIQKII